ncbi:UNVERIFIED_CONTAM: hypothetical protein Sangu_2145500 [Sesamum angustifolium]|uniref:Uncharacterized protein n=1 Tax=Sesamum angustifolium TaxID=2727405 RepID=A0AAW2LD40_9LAMI
MGDGVTSVEGPSMGPLRRRRPRSMGKASPHGGAKAVARCDGRPSSPRAEEATTLLRCNFY